MLRPPLPLALLATLAFAAMLGGLACTSDTAEPAGRGFYAEFEVTVVEAPNRDDPFPDQQFDSTRSTLRWWYSAGADGVGRWRWEIEDTTPTIDAGTRTTVFDGEDGWVYDDRSLQYQRSSSYQLSGLFGSVANVIPSPGFGTPIGPANVADIDAFIELWQPRQSDRRVKRVGEETVLGRRTEVIEIRPAWYGSSSMGTATLDGEGTQTQRTETSGGVIRVFIDPERMFVMRSITNGEGGGQSVTLEITRLDYEQPIDESALTFDPPSGASEVAETLSCQTHFQSQTGFGAPAGFLRASYVPSGFESSGSSVEGGLGCETVAAQAIVKNGGDYVLFRQRLRPAGLPPALHAGDPIEVNGDDAYLTEALGVSRLIWTSGDIVAELTSNQLPADELIRIAESARVTPASNRQ